MFLFTILLKLNVCSAGEWFYGTWRFDRDFSMLQLTNYTWKVPPSLPDTFSEDPFLVFSQLQDATIVMNTNEFTFSMNGKSHSKFYTVLSRTNESQAILKCDNGETNSVRLVKDHLEFGKVLDYKLYFLRVTN
jgi:hypothetical protein